MEISAAKLHDLLVLLQRLHAAAESGELSGPLLDLLQQALTPDHVAVTLGDQREERGSAVPGLPPLAASLSHEEVVLGRVELQRRAPYGTEEALLLQDLVQHAASAVHLSHRIEHATVDPGTKVRSRWAYQDQLKRELGIFKSRNRPFALLFCELDNLKDKIDVYGATVGMKLRSQTAQLLQAHLGRYTGRVDENRFVAILEGDADLRVKAETLRRAIEDFEFNADDEALHATLSVGVAALKGDETPDGLMRRATEALQAAQRAGGNRIELGR